MKLAVLPFNAAEGTSPALGRQLSNFASDAVRTGAGVEINTVSLLTQVEQEGIQRVAMVNISEGLLEPQWIADLFTQTGCDLAMDGLLKNLGDDKFELTVRFHEKDLPSRFSTTHTNSAWTGVMPTLRTITTEVANRMGATPGPNVDFATMDFGTDDPRVFLQFLEGYDSLMYLQQANGPVVQEFSPLPAMEQLLGAAQADPDFDGPYQALIGLCRAAAARRIGTFEAVEESLKKLQELHPDDFTAYFALGEAYQAINDANRATEQYEKGRRQAA